ncbi:F-actin-monooxygenase MICAL3 isoform X2 [Lampetra planeri]
MGDVAGEKNSGACALFDRFVQAGTCKGTLRAYQDLCELVDLKPSDFRTFYPKLKSKLNYWKAKGLWSKIDKRAAHKDYKKGKQCSNVKCLIIGAGPCGLRSAIELALLGAKVVVVEKRDAFSRNNVLHLWPYTIHDLKALGAKKFHGKFCAGAIDHISIRQLQLILLKVSLLLGVEIHVNVEFKGIMEPPEDQENDRIGWRAEIVPNTHPVAEYEFDVIIGADGHRNTLQGFRRKEFRGKLAIAITANFINRNTTAEAKVEELSGVAFIFNQKFFTDLRASKGIDLENIVYYKDDTHYFVMTAKKQSLLEKGVILQDYPDTEMLLSRENVDQEALQEYARGAADFSTNHQLPSLDFAINHYGQPDVAMFDFTCMYASENAALVRERHGHRLLVALVGDSLLEPFWPMGTGCARGFLAAFDSAWMIRSWAQGTPPLEVLAERESIYRLLPQTTPENINKNFSQYSIDPTTRYPNVNLNFLRASQVRHLYDTGEARETAMDVESALGADSRLTRHDSIVRSSKLLNWCQRQTEGYRSVRVVDFTGSWKSGLALCAIIHRYRPDLIDFDSLDERNVAGNNQLAFDVAEREFGISPIITGQEVAGVADPDKLSMVMYLSQFYEMFRDTLPPAEYNKLMGEDDRSAALLSTKSPISFLSKLGQTISRKRTPRDKKEKEVDGLGKRRRTGQKASDEEEMQARREDRWGVGNGERRADAVSGNQNKVKSMANQLLAKFEENAPLQSNLKRQGSLRKEFPQNLGGSDTCYFCGRRVYVMERLSAEGKFFHRGCFKCNYCDVTLRLGAFAFDVEDGKFYCKPHYCYRLSGFMQRKMQRNEMALDVEVGDEEEKPPTRSPSSSQPAPRSPLREPVPGSPNRDALLLSGSAAAMAALASVPSAGTAGASALQPAGAAATAALEEDDAAGGGSSSTGGGGSVPKRTWVTPERIELESGRLSARLVELVEVPEETLAQHNLSGTLERYADMGLGLGDEESSSDSDLSGGEPDCDEDADDVPLGASAGPARGSAWSSPPRLDRTPSPEPLEWKANPLVDVRVAPSDEAAGPWGGGFPTVAASATATSFTGDRWRETTKQGPTSPTAGAWADAARERAVPPAASVENDVAKPPSEANGTAVAGGSAEPKPNGGALEPSNSRERCLRLSVETEDPEEEEEEEAEEEGFSDDSGSDLGGMPWKEAVKRHEILRGRTAEEAEREAQRLAEEEARNLAEAGEAIALGLVDGYEDGDEEYDDDDEEEEEEEEGDEEDESSDVSRLKLRDKAKPTPVLDVQAPLSAKPPIPGSLQASPTAATVAEEMTSSRNHAVMAWLRATNGAETTATTAAATAAATAGAAGASNRKADEEPRSALPSPGSDLRSGGQAAPWTKHADATAPVNDSMSPPPLPQSQSAEPQGEAAESPHAPVPGPHDEKATFGGNAHGRRFQGDDILARGTATPALPHLNGLPSVWAELPLNIPSSKTDQAQSLGRKLQCPDLAKGPPLTLPLLPVSTQPKADSGSNCLPSKPLFAPSPPPVSSPNATSAAASKGHEASPRAFFSHSPLGPPPSKYDLLLWGLENPSSVIPPLPPQPPSSSFQPSWLLDANKSPLAPAKELASTGVAAQPHSPLGLAALQSPVTSHAAQTTPSLSKSLFYQSPLLSPLSPIPSTQSPSVILGLSQVSLISPKSFADQASPRSLQSPNGNLEQPRMTAASPAATKPQLGTVSPSAYFTPSTRPIPSPRTQLSPGLVSGLPQVPIVTPRSFMQRAGVSWEQPSNTQKTVTATEKNEKPKSEMTHAKDISAGDAGGVFGSTAAEEKDTIDRHRLEAELSWARFGIGGQERRQSPTASDSSGTISTPESARARSPAPRAEPGAGSGTVEPRPENQMSIPARPVVKSAAASKAEWLNTPSSLPASDSLSTALSRNHVAKTVGNGEELNHVDILHPEDVSVCLVEDVHPGAEGEDDPNTSTSLLLTPPSSPPPPPPPNEEPASLFVYRPHTTPPRARPLSLDAHLTPKRSAPSRLQDTLRQKSLEESIDEIPFADEEEDGDDDEGGSCADFRSPGSSVFLDESFHTPPTSRPAGRTRPVFDRDSSSRKTTPCSKISPEAKEVAESRLREREQVVKSNVLRDAMAQQREKLKGRLAGEASFFSSPAYAPHGKKPSTSAAEAATKPPSLMPSDRHVDSEPARRKHESAKGSKSVKLVDGDALKEESQVDDLPLRPKKKIPAKDLGSETSHTSSEDVPGKSKKRASLFSPRKNKKDKAAKMESQRAADAAALANESNASIAKSRSPLWKVFSHGYRKERRKEKELEERTRSSTTSSVGTVDSATEQPIITATPKPMALHPVLAMRRQASQTEDDSELSSEEVLNDPSCQRGRRRETRDIFDRVQPLLREGQLQKPYTEEELNEKLTRRVQRAARKQAKQEELKRLHRAQIIQRQLEEVEEKQRALEERGVAVEKALRGEADYWGDTSNTVDIYGLQLVGLGKKDDPRLMQEWFKLVQEKNTMVRYESELMIFARELELEDRQSRLQQDLRERMAVDDAQKSEAELSEEKRILSEMLDVVEQRDSLVALLEEQRLREREEDRDIEAIMLSRGYTFNWT